MSDTFVMKFGGTSMGSAERIRVAASIITAEAKRRSVVVVVSAMSKITDQLLEALRRAEVGDRSAVDGHVESLLDRHLKACSSLFEGLGSDTAPAERLMFDKCIYKLLSARGDMVRTVQHLP